VKLYFSDLSYLKAILSDMHAKGTLRQGATENMIFLELKRKLDSTHALYFYRKKSGAEISFIVENNENTLVTPMIVTTRATDVIPQVFRVFDTEYHDRVERYMIFNDAKSSIIAIDDKQVMILPHIGI
jgi:predicted AAA+ superfamily ATPase